MITVREHFGLIRQVRAATVHQVDARQPIFARDFLRPQVLFHGQRKIRAALDRRVVADNHAFAAFDTADAGNHARAMNGAVVHTVRRQRRKFQKRTARINKKFHTRTRQQFAARHVAFARARVTTARGFRAA